MRSHPRLASQAMGQASSTARTRLAQDQRFIGTALPGCTGGLHPWGRPLQSPPPLPSLVPGGGLSEDRPTWRPARAHGFVPVTARSPLSRARCKEAMRPAGLLAPLAPQGWTRLWHGQSRAQHHGHAACTSRAPAVCKVARSNRRLVGLKDRPVTCPSRSAWQGTPPHHHPRRQGV